MGSYSDFLRIGMAQPINRWRECPESTHCRYLFAELHFCTTAISIEILSTEIQPHGIVLLEMSQMLYLGRAGRLTLQSAVCHLRGHRETCSCRYHVAVVARQNAGRPFRRRPHASN